MTGESWRRRGARARVAGACAVLFAAIVLAGPGALPRPAAAAQIPSGSDAIVSADGDCLRMRDQPSLGGSVLTCIPDGSRVTVISEPVNADGFAWQQVSFAGQAGWVANDFLEPAPTTPVPTAAPTAVPTAVPTATATPAPVPVPSAANPLPAPPAGGLTLGLSGTSDPLALAAAQSFAVESISLLDVPSQRFLAYIPGAPPFASTLSSAQLQPASVVTIKRTGMLSRGAAPPRAGSLPVQGAGTALTTPPGGGLTQGVSTTNDPATLVAAQPFAVETVSLLDIPSQHWLVYIPGAPAVVSSLNSGSLAVGAVVTIRRGGSVSVPPGTPPPSGTPGGGFTPAPPAPATPGTVPGPAGNETAAAGGGTVEAAALRTVTVTYYYCRRGGIAAGFGDGGGFCGHMANGERVHAGAASCARSLLGERFRVLSDPTGRIYRCTDSGGGVRAGHRDI